MEQLEPQATASQEKGDTTSNEEVIVPIPSQRNVTPSPFARNDSKMDLDDYFVSLQSSSQPASQLE